MLQRQLRFRDLKARGVVDNWMTLNNWIDNEGFPSGRLTGPNIRTWNESDVEAWLESRPTARKKARVRAIA
jgi:predicted DNA-binding transcriptional regulator AlpA